MKIYLLITKYLNYVLDSVFPKKLRSSIYTTILPIYQRYTIVPSSYRTYSLLPYTNPYIKRIIWNFKFKRKKEETIALSYILYDEIISILSDSIPKRNVTLLYPPSSSYVLGKKNFDHMENLSKHLFELQNIKFPFFKIEYDAIGIKDNIHIQHTGTKTERREWSKNKYILVKQIDSRTVICIDDVLTTGSTLKSINDLLDSKEIYNITLSS